MVTGRMLWFDTTDLLHYPPFVDKTLKLFNLKQVAHELETSVMSKVSCTACKSGSLSLICVHFQLSLTSLDKQFADDCVVVVVFFFSFSLFFFSFFVLDFF